MKASHDKTPYYAKCLNCDRIIKWDRYLGVKINKMQCPVCGFTLARTSWIHERNMETICMTPLLRQKEEKKTL